MTGVGCVCTHVWAASQHVGDGIRTSAVFSYFSVTPMKYFLMPLSQVCSMKAGFIIIK